MPSSDPLLTPEEVSKRLGVSKSTLGRLYKAGRISFIRVGRQVRFREAAVEVFIAKQQGRAA